MWEWRIFVPADAADPDEFLPAGGRATVETRSEEHIFVAGRADLDVRATGDSSRLRLRVCYTPGEVGPLLWEDVLDGSAPLSETGTREVERCLGGPLPPRAATADVPGVRRRLEKTVHTRAFAPAERHVVEEWTVNGHRWRSIAVLATSRDATLRAGDLLGLPVRLEEIERGIVVAGFPQFGLMMETSPRDL